MKNKELWSPGFVDIDNNGFYLVESKVSPRSELIARLSLPQITRLIAENAQGHILDLGCGHLPYYIVYKDLVSSVSCTDWQSSIHQNEFLDVVSDLNHAIEFTDSLFDCVLFTDVLEHLQDPRVIFNEINRVLKPGGKLILSVPFLYPIHEEPHDHFRFTKYALMNLCAEANFKVNTLKENGGAVWVLCDLIAKIIPNRGMSRLFQKLAYPILNSAIFRKLDSRTSYAFPRAYILVASKI